MSTFVVFFRFPGRTKPDERRYVSSVPRIGEAVEFADRKWIVFNVVHEFQASSQWCQIFVELKSLLEKSR